MIARTLFFAGALALATAAAPAQTAPVSIHNAAFEVTVNPASGHVQVTGKPSGKTFIHDGILSPDPGKTSTEAVHLAAFGTGKAIAVTHENGDREEIMLFPKLPFVIFRSSLGNHGAATLVTNKVRTFSARLELGAPAGSLKTLGTGGLLPPDKNPGSYVWLAVANPESRNGVVAGWITHERGSGVVFSRVKDGAVMLDAQVEHGRLAVEPGQTSELETFAIGYFDDARLGLEAWAGAVAKVYDIKLRPQPAGYCTWYSKPFGGASDEKHLAELSDFAARELSPYGFSVVQIDDKWQAGISTNGPNRNFSTHAPKGPYPSGMKAAAGHISSLGLTPGIWFMPFAGTYYDPFFKSHQDWFVHRADGSPYETDWGGTCLDMTQAGARENLRANVRRIAGEWGFRYFKMDGLWTGTATKQIYVNTGYNEDGIGDSVFHDPGKTGIQAYRSGLRLVREAAGKDVFFLGCCAPQNMRSYGGAMGLLDAMRIGPDNGSDWDSLKSGPTFGSRQYFLHGRVWYNDPDPVYVRQSMPLNHARLICSWVALSGQLNLSSEWLPGLPADRLDILKRTMPNHGLLPRPVDLFDAPIPYTWLLTDTRRPNRRDVVSFFNWDSSEKTFDQDVARLGLDPAVEYVAYDYWANQTVDSFAGKLRLKVPAESCAILAVRPRADHPQLLSTSRHVTQGIVDVTEEKWHASALTLTGKSKIVGGDVYELRIIKPAKAREWAVKSVEVSSKDRVAGVKSSFQEEGGLIRVRIDSPNSLEVDWSVHFKNRE